MVSSLGSYISGFGVLIFLYGVVDAFMRKEQAARQSVGRRRDHAGMDAVVAAAVPPVRSAAARPVMRAVRGATQSRRVLERKRDLDLSVVDHNAIELPPRSPRPSVADYIALLKPRVMSLVIFTALVGLVIAPGHVHPVLAFTALLCIAVGAGASGALNMWYDGDIDALMSRTAQPADPARPHHAGRGAGLRPDRWRSSR